MTTAAPMTAPAGQPVVQRGHIYQLGRHRLMCGDATSKEDVAALFAGAKPTLVVTSPPYADRRDYNDPVPCWDTLMMGAFDGHDFADDVQMFINLGLIHIKGEYWAYWHKWLSAMRISGWQFFSKYIWDKGSAFPGNFGGRFAPCYEYIFHINRKSVQCNKIVPCKRNGSIPGGSGIKGRNNLPCAYNGNRKVLSHKIPDSVIRLPADKGKTKHAHPAKYPVGLPSFLIKAYKQGASLAYDPFCGSGTTLLACEDEDVSGLGMEISPSYVQIAIDRWNRTHPGQPAKRLDAAYFDGARKRMAGEQARLGFEVTL